MRSQKAKSSPAQSARFIEAAKAAGADQQDFERAFKKVVKPKKPTKKK